MKGLKINRTIFSSEPVRNLLAVLLIIAVVLPTYVLSSNNEKGGSKWSGDTGWMIYTAMSIIHQGNTDIDEYTQADSKVYSIENVNGHRYNFFPIGTSLLSLPAVYIIDQTSDSFHLDIYKTTPLDEEKYIASFFVTLTCVLLFFIGRILLLKIRYALLLAFVFSFCTSAWSVASRALWQHGPSMLMLTLALLLILLARKRPAIIQYSALPLAFSAVIRPTNFSSYAAFSIYILISYRRYYPYFFLWSLAVFVPFILYSSSIYDALLPTYFGANRLGSDMSLMVTAFSGNLISPARGLFVFSPVLLFSVWGIFIKYSKKQLEKLDYFIVAIIIFHWISISSFGHWWGGWTYGPRLFSDMIPFFVYFMIPVFIEMPQMKNIKKILVATAFCVLAAFSFFVHYRGATNETVMEWNKKPNDIDVSYNRLWEWSDPPFLRGL